MPTAIITARGLRSVAPTPKEGFQFLHPKSMGPSLVTTEVAHSRRVAQPTALFTEWLDSGAPFNAQLGFRCFQFLHPKSMGPSLVTTEVAHSRRVGPPPRLYTEWLDSDAPFNAQVGQQEE